MIGIVYMSEYIYTDEYEICLELKNDETIYIVGEARPIIRGKCRLIGDCFPLYSREERERRGLSLEEIPWIDLPYGDLSLDLSGGFVTLRRGQEIVFMDIRDNIKNSVTSVSYADEYD